MTMSDDLTWSDEYLDDADVGTAVVASNAGSRKPRKKKAPEPVVPMDNGLGTVITVGATDAERLSLFFPPPVATAVNVVVPGASSQPSDELDNEESAVAGGRASPAPPPLPPPDVQSFIVETDKFLQSARQLQIEAKEKVATPGTLAANTRLAIAGIIHDKRMKGDRDAIAQMCFNYILDNEAKNGSRLLRVSPGGTPHVVLGLTNKVVKIDGRDSVFNMHMWWHYNLRTDDGRGLGSAVTAQLKAYCTAHGKERTVRRFVSWSDDRKCLYVNRYDGTVWKISGNDDGLETISNGHEVLFTDDDNGVPPAPHDIKVAGHGMLLRFLTNGVTYQKTTPGGMTEQQQRLMFQIWVFALAFPDLFTTKPILLIDGPHGSGKSTALQLVQMVVHGVRNALIIGKGDEREFSVQIARTPIGFLDNVDAFVPWLQDAICAYCTSGQWQKRKLYTDDEVVTIKPTAFLAATSRSPSTFRRPDVADRTLIMKLDRRQGGFGSAYELENFVTKNRGLLFGEWLFFLNRIVKVLREGAVAKYARTIKHHRMADFTVMAHVIGNALGAPAEEINAMLDAVQKERDAFVAEGNVVKDLLVEWLGEAANTGRQIRQLDLFNELSALAQKHNRKFIHRAADLDRKFKDASITAAFDIQTEVKAGISFYRIEPIT